MFNELEDVGGDSVVVVLLLLAVVDCHCPAKLGPGICGSGRVQTELTLCLALVSIVGIGSILPSKCPTVLYLSSALAPRPRLDLPVLITPFLLGSSGTDFGQQETANSELPPTRGQEEKG